MDKLVETYRNAYKKHGISPLAQLDPKNRVFLRFKTIHKMLPKSEPFSILDYGCGLAFLEESLKKNNYPNFSYRGVDLVEDFININKERNPDGNYDVIKHYSDIQENYDYISLIAIFNDLYDDETRHKARIHETLQHLFNKTNICLFANFATDQVDFRQDGAYHQNPIELYNFVANNLSRRIILDQSYLPYEFSICIFKDEMRKTESRSDYLNEIWK